MPDTNRQQPTCALYPAASCERIVGQLSDYERGIWTPAPDERVSLTTPGGDDLFGTFEAVADDGRALILVEGNRADGWDSQLRLCRWDELAPAPPLGCECPVCLEDSACEACNCGACPFVHECGCAEYGCGCPAGGCGGATVENRSAR